MAVYSLLRAEYGTLMFTVCAKYDITSQFQEMLTIEKYTRVFMRFEKDAEYNVRT